MLILEGCSVQSRPPWCKISHRMTLCFLSLDGARQMGNTTFERDWQLANCCQLKGHWPQLVWHAIMSFETKVTFFCLSAHMHWINCSLLVVMVLLYSLCNECFVSHMQYDHMFAVWAQFRWPSNIQKYTSKWGFLHTSNNMPVSKVAQLLCCFVLTSKWVQAPLCADRVHQGSLSLHHNRLVTFPK